MMIDGSLTAAMGLGFLLGIRHAMDPDHIAAVSTFVSQHRSLAVSCLLGTCWGAGHTTALLLAGIGAVVFKFTISPEIAKGLEVCVALVLILLGGHVLLRLFGGFLLNLNQAHSHDRLPGEQAHTHSGALIPHIHRPVLELGKRPFFVGLLHGLAGSAALMLLVLAAIPSPLAGLLYIFVFGLGSTLGMLVLSGLIGIPFALSAKHAPAVRTLIQTVAGVASIILGCVWAWNLGGA